MSKKLGVLAVAIAAFAVACADSTSPTVNDLGSGAPSLDQNYQVVGSAIPAGTQYGNVYLCKQVSAGDPSTNSFAFTVSSTSEDGSSATAPLDATPDFTNIAPGTTNNCITIYDATDGFTSVDRLLITETGQANWATTGITVQQYVFSTGQEAQLLLTTALDYTVNVAGQTATVRGNSETVTIVTWTNDFTAPPEPEGCTYTKGWYQNKNGAPTVIAVDGRTKTQAQAIFAATPGKPGGVTWGVGNKPNNLLNLYQQLLAALNNLGGDANAHAGPAAVDTAIDAALAGTGGTGLNITTTLSESEIGSLTDVLSSFNEGRFAGYPHCG